MKILATTLMSFTLFAQAATLAVAPAAHKPPANVRALLKTESQLDDKCRGGSGDSPATQKACAQRDQAVVKLRRLGWCYGNGDANQIEADKVWQKCRKAGTH